VLPANLIQSILDTHGEQMTRFAYASVRPR
jgi:hypothetical protein